MILHSGLLFLGHPVYMRAPASRDAPDIYAVLSRTSTVEFCSDNGFQSGFRERQPGISPVASKSI